MGVQIPLFSFKTTNFGNTLMLLHLLGLLQPYRSTQDNTIRGLLWGKSSYVCVNRNRAAKTVAFDKEPLGRRRFGSNNLHFLFVHFLSI